MTLDASRHGVLIDTGLLVAVFNQADGRHDQAVSWMAGNSAPLLTVEPVLSEAAFFLPARSRPGLARLAAQDVLKVHHPDPTGYQRIAELLAKYADQDPDWADAALIWLAETTGCNRIATLDIADFSVYRINGRKRFEMALLD